nr:hypothetical protein [Bacilli bacterium]
MKTSNVMWGFVFILVGCILGVNALGIAHINIFFDGWWTLFIIVPAFINIFKDDDKEAAFVWLMVGVILLLACNDYISFDLVWKLALPAILVLIGISIMFKDRVEKEVRVKIKESRKDADRKTICATFQEKIEKADKKAEEVSLETIFASMKYDMRDVEVKKDMVIKTSTVFGSTKIIAPKGVAVKVSASGIFKDTINKVKGKDAKYTIYVDASTVFGSVIVSDK